MKYIVILLCILEVVPVHAANYEKALQIFQQSSVKTKTLLQELTEHASESTSEELKECARIIKEELQSRKSSKKYIFTPTPTDHSTKIMDLRFAPAKKTVNLWRGGYPGK